MKPSRKVSSGIEDLFRSRFENIINLRHELVVLGGRIAWTFFDETYEALYSEEGRPGGPDAVDGWAAHHQAYVRSLG